MILDSSALVAILAREPECDHFTELIVDAEQAAIAAPTVLETSIVLQKFGLGMDTAIRRFFDVARVNVVSFDADHLAAAQRAYRRFGRGTGHPAMLNFGDCIAYAASTIANQPLLYKGNDFKHTDVLSALDSNFSGARNLEK